MQLLSNGRYHVMVTNAGSGYSQWKNLAVTRWHEDVTCDNWGTFCYLRDVESGHSWSAAHQPTLEQADSYEAIFSQGRAEFRRRDNDFDTRTEIVVSPEDDIELRRIHVTNRSRKRRTIEVTSYAEVVLAPAAADALHPAFSNLFVQTEILELQRAILCTRRPRSFGEPAPWLFHLMAVHGADIDELSYETDRMRFVGRGKTDSEVAVAGAKDISRYDQQSPLDRLVHEGFAALVARRFGEQIESAAGAGLSWVRIKHPQHVQPAPNKVRDIILFFPYLNTYTAPALTALLLDSSSFTPKAALSSPKAPTARVSPQTATE